MNPNRTSFLTVLLLLTLTGCISLPDIDDPVEPEPPDTEDPKPLPDLSVKLQAPAGTTYTNGPVDVSIEVTNGAPEAVDLFAGTELLATLTGPYTFRWDTAAKPEGSYTLTAKARRGTQTFTSEERTVVVDRTPPQVVIRTPTPGAQQVSVRQPIRVTFSEPLDAASLTDTTVRLWMRVDSATSEVAKTLSLSADGSALTISPSSKPVAPGDMTLELGGVADWSGNSLVATESWSWRLPIYLAVGTALNADPASPQTLENALAVDAQGRPVVAWREPTNDGIHAYVRRWTGDAWEALGGAVSANPGYTSVDGLDLQVDPAGNPVMAWSETNSQSTNDIYVQRWMGGSWHMLGSALRAKGGSSKASPSLAVDGSGGIFVAWTESDGSLTTDAYVRRWTGSAWEAVGGALSASAGSTSVLSVTLQLNASGQPVVAWSETDGTAPNVHVQRWTGSVWEPLGVLSAQPGNTPASSPSLRLDLDGRPVVAWSESDGEADNTYVWRWTGSSWEAVGGPLSASAGSTPAARPSLELDTAGMPVVSWVESDGTAESVHVWRWGGGSWTQQGAALSANPGSTPVYRHALKGDSRGNLFICWSEYGPLSNHYNLYVRQLNN